MNDWLLFDPLFRVPFFTGLCLAIALSVSGAYLRMRREWLAAFGLAHVAAAGGILSIPTGLPVVITATGAAGLAALVKGVLPRAGNSHYALLAVIGWSGALLLAGNVPHGEVIGESLLRGQLYFVHGGHLFTAVALVAVLFAALTWLSPRLIIERFYPDYFSANCRPAWPHRLGFGTLVVISAVLGTLAMGAMPAFAMFFAPAWTGFALVDGWRRALWATVAIGVGAYLVAFAAAILLDQPFGPVLGACLAATLLLRLLPRARRHT